MGRYGRQQRPPGIVRLGSQQRRILRGDQGEPVGRQGRLQQSEMEPLHIDTNSLRFDSSAIKGNLRHVKCRHLPSATSQPDRIGPFAAPYFQYRTGLEAFHERDE
jgi:hypothetical protein